MNAGNDGRQVSQAEWTPLHPAHLLRPVLVHASSVTEAVVVLPMDIITIEPEHPARQDAGRRELCPHSGNT